MPNTVPNATKLTVLQDKYRRAAKKSVTHSGFFIGATTTNLDDLIDAVGTPQKPMIQEFVELKFSWAAALGDLCMNRNILRIFLRIQGAS